MDIVLGIADDRFLDKFWATILPQRLPVDNYLLEAAAHNCSSCLKPSNVASSVLETLRHAAYTQQEAMPEWITVSAWPRDDWRRQYLSLCLLTMIGIHLMYFIVAGLSYTFIFDHRMMRHPRFLKGQIKMEIKTSLWAFPTLTLITVPWFLGDVRGWSRCYDTIADSPLGGGVLGWTYLIFSCAFFLWFTDLSIYFIHRWEHIPSVYKRIHKPHHKWVIPTPFASHAFHPLDGYVQSLPYHFFIYLFPLHKKAFLGLFVVVNLWTIFIHDSDMIVDHPLEKVINGPSHHTLHHLYFTCNYGQYFTYSDRIWGSYRHPAKGDDPLLVVLAQNQKSKQTADTENVRRQQEELKAALAVANGPEDGSESIEKKSQ